MNSTCELCRHSARALKPYPACKDSRIDWLREVPEHWQVRRLKTLCSRSALYGANVAATSYTTAGVRFLRTTDITEDGQLNGRGVFLPRESVDNYLLADGDVLISRSGTIGRSFLYERRIHGPCAYAGYLVRFVPAPIALPKYILLFTKTHAFAGFLRVKAISSTIENVNGEKYANCPLPLPPHSEQAAIVRFLDHADRRIRRYIRAKQKLITLLEEQKQAFIHQAVTGQINVRTGKPYQAYKPSGVEWFPEVPDHWNVLPMRRVIYSAVDGPHFSPTYLDTGIPFLSARNVKAHAWSLEDAKYISEDDYDKFNQRVKPVRGDVLYTKGGTTGVARVVDLTFPFQVWVHIAVLKVNKNAIDPGFLAAALNSTRCYEQSQLFTRGATNQDLGLGRMKAIELPVPPALAEQQTIVGYLRTGLGQVLEAISATHRDIGLIREYRTRLITDVVTGKIDVREAAAGLPDEVEELEPLDEADALIDGEEEPTDALATAP